MEPTEDKDLFIKIKLGDQLAFKAIFEKYYQPLCHFANQFLNEKELAEEVVQNIFVKIWEKRNDLNIETSVKHYFFRSVRNQCLNQLQHQKIKNQYAAKMKNEAYYEPDPDEFFVEVDLAEKIEKCIESMPPKRKEIFKLSREQGLRYKDIADSLNISVKTVEAQMGLALKHLREELSDFKNYFANLLFIFKKSGKKY